MGKILLVIEDDPYVQRMYQRMFTFKKHETILASNGTEGLKAAKTDKPAVILLDIILPDINGLEVLKKLKADPQTAKIPVLMLTNISEESVGEEAKKLGAGLYMVKADYSPEEMVAQVEKYL